MLHGQWKLLMGCTAILAVATFTPRQVSANHSWGGYHWDGPGLPVSIVVGDNLTSNVWGTHLQDAVADWNQPTGGAIQAVHLSIQLGETDPASCAPTLGRIEVCNWTYGDTGWLGLAQVWTYRGKAKHIAQATTLLNDTYFADPFYDTAAWRQAVTCQEIAHDFGLDHQDENFNNYNLGSCMDYSAVPEGSTQSGPANTSPNQHDFDQLATIYAHLADGGSTGGGGGGGGGGRGGRGQSGPQFGPFPDLPARALQQVPIDSPAAWGQLIRANGRSALYELDLGNGFVLFTFVTWAF
jgi:hypothetical protein